MVTIKLPSERAAKYHRDDVRIAHEAEETDKTGETESGVAARPLAAEGAEGTEGPKDGGEARPEEAEEGEETASGGVARPEEAEEGKETASGVAALREGAEGVEETGETESGETAWPITSTPTDTEGGGFRGFPEVEARLEAPVVAAGTRPRQMLEDSEGEVSPFRGFLNDMGGGLGGQAGPQPLIWEPDEAQSRPGSPEEPLWPLHYSLADSTFSVRVEEPTDDEREAGGSADAATEVPTPAPRYNLRPRPPPVRGGGDGARNEGDQSRCKRREASPCQAVSEGGN
ncbi:skin secretory protein xP2-like [Bacillus rossius redtenbacheri]|uniref:skin secretory protein xP2-like n=1 Tax=Bacillus rossius redtenbacheri TaxID=93214 RepID=UPI002FDE5ECB